MSGHHCWHRQKGLLADLAALQCIIYALVYVLSGRLVTGRPMTAPKSGNWMEAARAVSMDSMSGVAALYLVAVTSSLSFGLTTKGRSLILVGAMRL